MLLGKRILGPDLAAAEAAKGDKGQVVSVVLGPRILGKTKPIAPAPALRKADTPATDTRGAVPKGQQSPAHNKVGGKAPSKRTAAEPAVLSYTEDEVFAMLEQDANLWPKVLDAESKRPDGPRPAIAALVLSIVDRAVDVPVPEEVLTELEALVTPKVATT